MRGLKGKTAIVTGALGDLGYASAVRLLEEGCKVTMFDLKEDSENKAKEMGTTLGDICSPEPMSGVYEAKCYVNFNGAIGVGTFQPKSYENLITPVQKVTNK